MTESGQQLDAQQQSGTTDSKQQPAGAAEKAGKQDRYVYLSNLPVEAFEGTIRHVFEKEGIQVESVELIKKGSFNRRHNSGLATVKVASAADAARSCELLDGKMLQVGADTASGRPMIVRKNKFECCQLGYGQQQEEQEAGSSDADS